MKKGLLVLSVIVMVQLSFAQKVTWYSTTENDPWKTNAALKLRSAAKGSGYYEVQWNEPRQTIEGFGACFNEISWDAIQLVDKNKQEEIVDNLFDTKQGLNFTFCRTSIGANDYSRNWYSYDETPGDFELKHFSIERDKQAVIPYIKAALQRNPAMKIWASPWSAPTWMKINQHYANKSTDCNDLQKEREVPLYTDQVIQDPRYLKAFALYFSKYLDAYKKEGINISMVMYQNEAFTFSQWPNGSWTPQSIARFNMDYLGPQLAKTHPHVDIYAGTFNTSDPKVYEAVLGHPDAKKYIKGVGVQWEGRNIFPSLKDKYPGFKLMQSESECGWGGFSWKDAEHTFNLMKYYINNGANTYMGWNMVLKDDGSSSWCWKQNALIRVMSSTKEVLYTPEYYVYKHVTGQVPVGSVVLPVKSATAGETNMLAFRTPQNNLVLVAANYNDKEDVVTVKINKKYFSAPLNARSFNTFILSN